MLLVKYCKSRLDCFNSSELMSVIVLFSKKQQQQIVKISPRKKYCNNSQMWGSS